jgi:nucleotide-binding universal stress UspA family protein
MSVVVAVDGSAGSVNAIRLASSEAQWRQQPLVAVTAYRTDRTAGVPAGRPLSTLRTRADDEVIAQTMLRDAVHDALADGSSEVELRVVPGVAGHAIIDAAREEHAQLIVLAARSGISVLPGTVSQYVLRNARCPVMVVPAGRDAG